MYRTIVAASFIALSSCAAMAQTGSAKTQSQLNAEINALFPDQTAGAITPFNARQTLLDMVASPTAPPSGSLCSGVNTFGLFANTTNAPTNVVLNIYDGTQCVPWASLNQTAHTFTFGAPTGSSLSLIGQGASTTVSTLVQPSAPANGRAYAFAAQTLGNGSGGQKVAIYGAAQNGVGNSDEIWAANFLANWDVVSDVDVQAVEIDFNNQESNTFSQAKAGLSINSGGTFHAGTAIGIGSTSGSNSWSFGMSMTSWLDSAIVLGAPSSITGGIGISAQQLANGNDTILLQRNTDSGPTGQLLRAVNAANSANIAEIDVGGNFLAAGAYTTGSAGGTVNGTVVFNGTTSGSAHLGTGTTGGHLSYANSGSAPTLTSGCNGAGSSISGTDISGQVNGQTAAATTCTVTFGTAYGAAPFCNVSGQTTPVTGFTPGTSTLVFTFSSTASAKFNWTCYGT